MQNKDTVIRLLKLFKGLPKEEKQKVIDVVNQSNIQEVLYHNNYNFASGFSKQIKKGGKENEYSHSKRSSFSNNV